MEIFMQSLNPASRPLYQRWIDRFQDEVEENAAFPTSSDQFNDSHHGVIITFFQNLHDQEYATSTLWCVQAVIKRYLQFKYKYQLDQSLPQLERLLKQWEKSEEVKKAPIFSQDSIRSFLQNAPDDKFLLAKVILSIGVHGLMRSAELLNLDCSEVEVEHRRRKLRS